MNAEGNDPLVLAGSMATLCRTRYLEFEHHRVGEWATTALQDVVAQLDSVGFGCFWTFNDGNLVAVTGSCWHASFGDKATRTWSNLACVKRGDPWWDIMQEFHAASLRKAPPRANLGF